jgi:hypothetical protein
MSQKTKQPLYLIFSLPTEEKQPATASAAVEQLTVFSYKHGGDWHVRFQEVPDKIWIPHPLDISGILLPCPSGRPDTNVVYQQVDVSPEPSGYPFCRDEILEFSGLWQPWRPGSTKKKDLIPLEQCLKTRSLRLPTPATTMETKSSLPGFWVRFTDLP